MNVINSGDYKVTNYTPGQRVSLRIEADIDANTYKLYVNEPLVAENSLTSLNAA